MIEFKLGKNSIDKVASAILGLLSNGGIVLLKGDLASGKTTLVKSIAKIYGIKQDVIASPTFSIMNSCAPNFFHYDVYQVGLDGVLKNGLFENLQEKGLHLIEWGDEEFEAILKRYGFKYMIVEIGIVTPQKRVYKIII